MLPLCILAYINKELTIKQLALVKSTRYSVRNRIKYIPNSNINNTKITETKLDEIFPKSQFCMQDF